MCKKAVENLMRVFEIEDQSGKDAAVRSCVESSDRKSVQCIVDAKTVAEVEACQRMAESNGEPGAGSDEALNALRTVVDAACACPDRACADAQMNKLAEVSKKYGNAKPSADQLAEAEALSQRLVECYQKL